MAESKGVKFKWYEWFSYLVVTTLEGVFYKFGKCIANRPFITVGLCLIIVSLFGLGMFRFYQEKNPIRLWLPQQSTFIKNSELIMDTFDTIFKKETMQIVADDVLTPRVMQKLYEVSEKVNNSATSTGVKWTDVCFKIPRINEGLKIFISNENFDHSIHLSPKFYCKLVDSLDKECFQVNLLDLWNNNKTLINNLNKADILEKINNYKEDTIFRKNYEELLGTINRNKSGHIVSAKSLNTFWMTYYNISAKDVKTLTHDWSSKGCLEWEAEFINIMKNASKNAKDLAIYYAAGRSFSDISQRVMFQDLDILCCGIAIMLLFVLFVISKFNCVEIRVYLAVLSLFSVGMAFMLTCSLCAIFGLFYGPVHTSLPFLLLGLGVDDMFVIIAGWERLTTDEMLLPLSERVGIMLKHVGTSITITTITDVLAFIVGSFTELPCLQSFCIYAAIGVFLTLVFVVTFFLACFTIDQMRIENKLGGILFCKKYDKHKAETGSQTMTSKKIFKSIYSKIILTLPGKIFVIIVTMAFMGISLEGVFKLEQRYDPKWFIPTKTYLGQFYAQQDLHFPLKGDEGMLLIGALNYTHEFQNIHYLIDTIKSKKHIIADITSWVEPFRDYVEQYFHKDLYMKILNDTEFKTYLSKFLFSAKGARYQSTFKFKTDLQCGKPAPDISMSKMDFTFVLFKTHSEQIPAMKEIVKIATDANFTTGDRFSSAWSRIFGTWIIDDVIGGEIYRNMGLALTVVMLCTFLIVANFQICFWIFVCIVLSMINVFGFMHRWGLTIDLITCIGLQLAIGLCVDYSTHIGYTFLTISGTSLNDRVLETVTNIGPAVFYGGISTLISIFMLGFSEAYNFQAFFKIFLLEVLFGLFHGIILLPVILSFIGPRPYVTNKRK